MLLWWSACAAPEPAEPGGPVVRFDLSPGAALFDAPFPSIHREGKGVADWPNPDALPWFATLVDAAPTDGFGATSGILFAFDGPVELEAVDVWRSVEPDAPAFLVALDTGERIPVDLYVDDDGGPFGAPHLVTVLPLQGAPLRPRTTYAAVLRPELGGLGVPAALREVARGRRPAGWTDATYAATASALAAVGGEVAALSVFTTGDPTAELLRFVEDARAYAPVPLGPLTWTETHDAFCVFESTIEVPVYQAGDPPYLTEGGGWATGADGGPALQGTATSRLFVTVPRAPMPASGYPVAVMVRTGGGGDRPLVDRGPRAEAGGEAIAPGTGPALEFACVGFAGVQVDGPLGGPYRNPEGADEQFLVFNVSNPIATRDNVRQSALELALLPQMLDGLSFDARACDGASPEALLDGGTLALLGHSMGATIAPLALAAAPEFDLAILSGFGGSYLENLVYKEAPLEVRPIAEALLGYSAVGRTLTEGDPVLQLLQWVSEPADPPVYGALVEAHVLMEQGIVDHYILPPIANAGSLSFGLDLGGDALDEAHPDLAELRPLGPLLPLVGGARIALPAGGNRAATRIVVQHPEDGIEDGHEVLFQTEAPKREYRCVLADLAAGRTPTVPAAGEDCG